MKKLGLFLLFLIVLLVAIIYFYNRYNRQYIHPPLAYPVSAKRLNVPNATCPALFTILSVDGGGARGVIPLAYLDRLERLTHRPIGQLFDLMSGISTGGIIVAALAVSEPDGRPRYTAKAVLSDYYQLGPKIFSTSTFRRILTIDGLLSPSYSSKLKYQLLKKYYGKTRLHELTTRLLLFSYDSASNQVVSFCNWKHCNEDDNNYSLVSIVSGVTSPVPFFSPQVMMTHDHKVRYILNDLAYNMNNPALFTYLYAKRTCPQASHYVILSLGTGKSSASKTLSQENARGQEDSAFHWLPKVFLRMIYNERKIDSYVLRTFVRSVNAANHSLAKDGLPKVILIRLNLILPPSQMKAFNSNQAHLKYLIQRANQEMKRHKKLFICLARLLRHQPLSAACKRTLIKANDIGMRLGGVSKG